MREVLQDAEDIGPKLIQIGFLEISLNLEAMTRQADAGSTATALADTTLMWRATSAVRAQLADAARIISPRTKAGESDYPNRPAQGEVGNYEGALRAPTAGRYWPPTSQTSAHAARHT